MPTVWVDDWQMQCCGDAFEVGGQVTWNVRPIAKDDNHYMQSVLGEAMAATVDYGEEHHDDPHPDDVQLTGTVRDITAVFCQFAPLSKEPRSPLYPVRGASTFEQRQAADGWERAGDDLEFVGYVVAVETVADR